MGALSIRRVAPSVFIRRLALAYLLVWVLFPPLAYGIQWRVIAVVAMSTWMLLELSSRRSVLLRPNSIVLGAIAFVVYTLAIEWLVPDLGAFSRHYQVLIMLFFLLVGESFRRGREDDARFCFWIVLLVLPIGALGTLQGLDTFGTGAARVVTRSSTQAMEFTEQGIGGFSLVYTTVLCLPFLLTLALNPRSLAARFRGKWGRRGAHGLVVVNLALALLLVTRAGYTIALLLASATVAIVMLVRSRRAKPLILSLCTSALLITCAVVALNPVLDTLQVAAAGTEYETKVRDVRFSLQGGESEGTVEDRMERYTRSLDLFFENPVLGTFRFDDLGKHSAILDRFAQYGFGVGLLFLWLIGYVAWNAMRDQLVPIGMAVALLVVSIGFPLMNNVFIAWGVALYVFSRGTFVVMGIPLEKRAKSAMAVGAVLSNA